MVHSSYGVSELRSVCISPSLPIIVFRREHLRISIFWLLSSSRLSSPHSLLRLPTPLTNHKVRSHRRPHDLSPTEVTRLLARKHNIAMLNLLVLVVDVDARGSLCVLGVGRGSAAYRCRGGCGLRLGRRLEGGVAADVGVEVCR
jgi:hypothetical protein